MATNIEANINEAVVLGANNLNICCGKKSILSGINLELFEGQIFSIVGPNGAGKSTLIRCLTGLIPPSSGAIKICGYDLHKNPVAARKSYGISLTPEELPTYLSGNQFLEMIADIRNVDVNVQLINNMKMRFLIENWLAQPIHTYSLGTKVKISIIASLIGAPRLLFFDEPFNGLDPVSNLELKKSLLELREMGHSIVLTTHMLDVAAKMSDRAALLLDGVFETQWNVSEMKKYRDDPDHFEHIVANEILSNRG